MAHIPCAHGWFRVSFKEFLNRCEFSKQTNGKTRIEKKSSNIGLWITHFRECVLKKKTSGKINNKMLLHKHN